MTEKKISIIIFFWSVVLYCINLQYNLNNTLNITLFWSSIFLMFGMVIYQIFSFKKNPFILFEIFIIFFLFHLVYQLGYYGLRGSDIYIDYNFVKIILNNHHFILGKDMLTGWPMMHIFSSIISIIIKVEPIYIAKFIPSFISSIIIIPIYLLTYSIYKNQKIALFSCLVFGTIPQFVSFNALLVRETYAFYFFILFFYILYTSKQRENYRLKFLLFILIPLIVLSHHFTSFMLIILLTIYIISSKLIQFLSRNRELQKFNKIDISNIYILLLMTIFFYWTYVTIFISKDFLYIYNELAGIKNYISYAGRIDLGTPIATLRGNIIYYGFFFLNGIICLILMIKIFFKRNEHKIEEATFTFFLYFCLFLGFLSLFYLGSLIFPDRFIPFGFVFGLIPLVAFLFSLKKNMYKKIFLIIITLFLIFNVYNIDPNFYTGNASVQGGVTTEKEYAIAETINAPNSYYGYIGASNAIYDIQGISFKTRKIKNPITTTDFLNNSDFAIINEGMYLYYLESTKIKSIITYNQTITVLSYKNFYGINKICDLGDIYILNWKK